MPGRIGRALLLEFSTDGGSTFETVAGLRSKNIAGNKDVVDITDDDSAGFRELLARSGHRSIEISASGVTKSRYFRDLVYGSQESDPIHDVRITYPNGDVYLHTIYVVDYTETKEYRDAVAFEISFQLAAPPPLPSLVLDFENQLYQIEA